MATTTQMPADCAVLIVAGPKSDFLSPEIDLLEDYLKNNGALLFLIEPDPKVKLPRIKKFLEKYGAKVEDDIIIDPLSRIFGGDYFVPLVSEYPFHEITRDFRIATFFPTVRSLSLVSPKPEGCHVRYLAKTHSSSWGEKDFLSIQRRRAKRDEEDRKGPLPVALTVDIDKIERKEVKAKIAIFGDSDFITNANLNTSGNKDLFLNTLSWLAEEEDLISIRPKERTHQPLSLSLVEGRILFWIPLVILPAFVLFGGIGICVLRRRK
jgi:ABC-type uncharacterized transport system involved in gliding motility auxiliary subunit